ncbi:octanoyltransferase [Sporormia fimetaria CBS 119925]|uniref:Octanoyltransferase n=1 Tax=Sporormia fimetaria CBS 119925 TaxID=1340428 RepID=A0A6A6VSC9_9PLEO|nr:octanoyltransferase [Sporormia fimetaria CBS 119925]
MRLQRLHFPTTIPYTLASTLQESLVTRFLASKASPHYLVPPPPTIITASFTPTYTLGRRDQNTLTPCTLSHLSKNGTAAVHTTLRGGQTTFHGPGQLVAYPILDLRAHKLRPRDYICLLEASVIATCKRFGITAFRTQNTGVWVSEDEKIAALGVHMRRNITSHGIGLNVSTDLSWFDRIVACGLEGKRTVSFESLGVKGKSVEEVGRVFVEEMAERLEGVEAVVERDAGVYMKLNEVLAEEKEDDK